MIKDLMSFASQMSYANPILAAFAMDIYFGSCIFRICIYSYMNCSYKNDQ